MKKRIDWFGVVVICTVLLWLAWGAVATAAPRVAGNALIVHSQDSGTFPTPGVMNFNGILGDIDGGLWTQDGYRGWVRLCTDVAGLGCTDAGTVKTVTGSAPIGVVHDGGGGYNVSLLPGYLTGILPIVATSDGGGGYAISFNASNFDAGLVKVITGTLPVIATSDAGGGYDISLRTAACTGTYAALQYDAGFYCAQLAINTPDSGYVNVTGTLPIRVVSDAGGGYDVSLTPGYITGILPVVATSDGGGGYAIGMSTAACTGTYAALQYDAGFYCSQLPIQIPDSGYVSVTGTAPIVVTADGGGGYNVSLPASADDQVLVSNSSNVFVAQVLPNSGNAGDYMKYDTGTNTFSVGSIKRSIWSGFCPGTGSTCNATSTPMLSFINIKGSAWKLRQANCNALTAGAAGTMTVHIYDVAGAADADSCTMTCTAVGRTGSSCDLTSTLGATQEYRIYISGCDSPANLPVNTWCNITMDL